MPIDTTQAASPGWWLARLMRKLGENRDRYDLLDAYYRNQQGIPVGGDKAVKAAYRRLMAMSRTNFAELVVEAVRARMSPLGFRTGASADDLGDEEAWRIWQANSLDADSALVDRAALSMSQAFVIVGGVDPDINAPLITPEDPREVAVETAPGRRRKVLAAVKVFRDDVEGVDRAYLYLPGLVYRATRTAPASTISDSIALDAGGWEWEANGKPNPERLPAPVVPVVSFVYLPNMNGGGVGEFEASIPVLDRINYTVLNRLEIATLQAFRQRGIKGLPNTDENGQLIDYDDIFASDPGAFWLLPETADVWESGVVDLNPIRQSIRDDIQDLAAGTLTPLFYLTPEGANGSAEGASLSREGLVMKVKDRLAQAGESWEQVMSLAFLFAGDKQRASRPDMEVIWAPPDRVSLAERYDAAVKAKAAGVPQRTIDLDILGYSPQAVARMESERAGEALLAPLAPVIGP